MPLQQLLHLAPRYLLPVIGCLAGMIVVVMLIGMLLQVVRFACGCWAGLLNDFRRRNWFGMDRRRKACPVVYERRRYLSAWAAFMARISSPGASSTV